LTAVAINIDKDNDIPPKIVQICMWKLYLHRYDTNKKYQSKQIILV